MDQFLQSIDQALLGQEAFSMGRILLSLLVAILLSWVLAWTYVASFRGLSFQSTLVQSQIILAVIVALIMHVVGDSIARAFGMFGALALIRFRTPIKDSWDTVFLFAAVAIGLSSGTERYGAALVGTLVLCPLILFLSWTRFGTRHRHDGLLRIRVRAGEEPRNELTRLLDHFCRRRHLVHMREVAEDREDAWVEHAYQLSLVHKNLASQLIDSLLGLEDCRQVSLLMQEDEIQP